MVGCAVVSFPQAFEECKEREQEGRETLRRLAEEQGAG